MGRRARAVELAVESYTYEEIAREVGYANRGTAYRVVQQALSHRWTRAWPISGAWSRNGWTPFTRVSGSGLWLAPQRRYGRPFGSSRVGAGCWAS